MYGHEIVNYTLEQLTDELSKRGPDTAQHRIVVAEFNRRALIAQMEAAKASEGAAKAAEDTARATERSANWIKWSVIVMAGASVLNVIVTLVKG